MMNIKRLTITLVVATIAIGSLGLLTASAAPDAPTTTRAAQDDDGQAWLGVTIRDTDDGVLVDEVVPGSPADEAGLRPGDIIEAVDGEPVESAEMLVDLIASYAPGDTVVITIVYQGQEREFEATLAARPVAPQPYAPGWRDGQRPFAGMLNFMGLSAEMTDNGLLVQDIRPASPLAEAGFQADDLITAINGEPVADMQPMMLLELLRPGEPLVFTVERDGEEIEIEVALDDMGFGPGDGFGFGRGPVQLGVQVVMLTPTIAENEGLPVEEGAWIVNVLDGSPAAEAGLQTGDIVVAVNGEAVTQDTPLRDALADFQAEDVVTLDVLRDGEELSLEVTLGARSEWMWQPGQGRGGQGRGQGQGRFSGPGQGMMPHFFGPAGDMMPHFSWPDDGFDAPPADDDMLDGSAA